MLAAGKIHLKNAVIRFSRTAYTYNAKMQKPVVTVKYRGKKLRENRARLRRRCVPQNKLMSMQSVSCEIRKSRL